MTRTQISVYRLFILTILLVLLLFASGLFLTSPPLLSIGLRGSSEQSEPWVRSELATLTGFIACAAYIVATSQPERKLRYESLFVYSVWGWGICSLLIAVYRGLAVPNSLGTTTPIFTIVQIIFLTMFTTLITLSAKKSPFTRIWAIGMVIVIAAKIAAFAAMPYFNFMLLNALAYPLMTLAVGFWLISRFSNMAYGWVKDGLYILAGLISLAGGLLIFLPGWGTNIIVFIVYGMIAARSYRALTRHNDAKTLASHWYAFSVILLWIGSIPLALGGIELVSFLMGFAALSMILGGINQSVAEMRGINRRITGLLPFWCIIFGVIALGYILSVDTIFSAANLADEFSLQPIFAPMNTIASISLISIFLGMTFYALGFWARRIKT